MKRLLVLLVLLVSCFTYGQNSYHVVKKIHVTSNGFWDYISVDTRGFLYISHNDIVQVLNPKTEKVVATITDVKGVHGIAIAEDLQKGFISSGRDSTMVVFDLKTFKVLKKVKVTGANPDCILYDAYSQKVFTFNGRSADATVLDAKTDAVIATIPLAGKPEFSVTDNKGKLYVNIEDKSMLTCIDTKNLKVINIWSLSPGTEPSGLTADFKTGHIFSVCDNNLMTVFDIKSGKVINTLKIGSHTDGAAFDQGLNRVYSSNGEGTLTVVSGAKKQYQVVGNFTTQAGARTICVNEKTHHLYLPTAEFEPKKAGERWAKMKPNTFVILDIAPQ